jgi:hypothetical protein
VRKTPPALPERVTPTTQQSTADGQLTAFNDALPEAKMFGTTCSVQVLPPSDVVTTALLALPTPTAVQAVAVAQETFPNASMPEGSSCDVQVVPPSVVA